MRCILTIHCPEVIKVNFYIFNIFTSSNIILISLCSAPPAHYDSVKTHQTGCASKKRHRETSEDIHQRRLHLKYIQTETQTATLIHHCSRHANTHALVQEHPQADE